MLIVTKTHRYSAITFEAFIVLKRGVNRPERTFETAKNIPF